MESPVGPCHMATLPLMQVYLLKQHPQEHPSLPAPTSDLCPNSRWLYGNTTESLRATSEPASDVHFNFL